MTELEKIEYAKSFIDKLAEGVNPLDGNPIAEGEVAKNPRMSKCFAYVSGILSRVIENGGYEPRIIKRQPRKEFSLSMEKRAGIALSPQPVLVGEMARYLNSLIDPEVSGKIPTTAINEWLLKIGFLEEVELPSGRHRKLPTEIGMEMGIFAEERTGPHGTYLGVFFNQQAQRFVYDNLDAIVELRREKKMASVKNKSKK